MTAKEEDDKERANNEIMFLNRVKGSPHLAQMIESCEDECLQKVHIYLENAGNMTLEDLMQDSKEGLENETANDLFKQLATAVGTLHEFKVCHRDLKPDNIILRPDPTKPSGHYLTLVDFNVALDLTKNPVMTGSTGLKCWSAPEMRSA